MKKLTKGQWQDRTNHVILQLNCLKDELARLGLFRTMHKLDLSTREIGWEMSDVLTGKQKTVDAFLKRKRK
jgi:hypothetical protein